MALTRDQVDRAKRVLQEMNNRSRVNSDRELSKELLAHWLLVNAHDLIACADVAIQASITIPKSKG